MNPAEEYILRQAEPHRSMLLHLQVIIEHTVPQAALKFKWSIPFYFLHDQMFCYLNVPASKKYVDLVFAKADELPLFHPYLERDKRKKMRSLRYTQLEEINDDVLMSILTAAKKLY
ncbi:hypothetical protein GCM10009117_22310 [Gangjinia marincola]|uniref:YdhG-like domain-containing protein n=1 Tax=Gangjinia marincola TaxID=578463 RepID=A0ABN1MJ23_9FLAO